MHHGIDSWGALIQKSEYQVELSSDCSMLRPNNPDYREVENTHNHIIDWSDPNGE